MRFTKGVLVVLKLCKCVNLYFIYSTASYCGQISSRVRALVCDF